jgi:preprotein translocase subunit SecE
VTQGFQIMAEHDNEPENEASTAAQDAADAPLLPVQSGDAGSVADGAPAQFGVTRYVHAAFLAVAVSLSYVAGKCLELLWNSLAGWPAATRQLPWLLRFREDERTTPTMVLGLLIGLIVGLWLARKKSVRTWADDVAGELAKVHWPNRELVQNGTLVVVITGLFATIYVGLLDRLWIFVTTLVYGA